MNKLKIRAEYKNPCDQQRNSVLKKFITKKDVYEKNPDLVKEYRERYYY